LFYETTHIKHKGLDHKTLSQSSMSQRWTFRKLYNMTEQAT